MSDYRLTRRQLHLILLSSVAALGAPSTAQQTAATGPPELPWITSWLKTPLPSEQAQKVFETLQSLSKTLNSLRSYRLPEGSEPAFHFKPTVPTKR